MGIGTNDKLHILEKTQTDGIYKVRIDRPESSDIPVDIPTKTSDLINDSGFITIDDVPGGGGGTTNYSDLTNKPQINSTTLSGNKTSSQLGLQSTLVSGTNIKTINNLSILGSGNIDIEGGGGEAGVLDVEVDGTSVVNAGVAEIDLTGKSNVGHTHTVSNITDFPSTATSSTSGLMSATDKSELDDLVGNAIYRGIQTLTAGTTSKTYSLGSGRHVGGYIAKNATTGEQIMIDFSEVNNTATWSITSAVSYDIRIDFAF